MELIFVSSGATPNVPQGFKVEALATDLSHPRSIYVLPNGDVLVVAMIIGSFEGRSPEHEPATRHCELGAFICSSRSPGWFW